MLARLEWELKQREQLASRQSSLEASIKSKLEQTQKLEEKLSRLRPALEQLRVSSLALEEFFDTPVSWEREQRKLAVLLPRPLYMLFVQSEGYSKAEDSLLKVIVDGNLEEAKTFDTTGQKEETQQDEETESEQSGTKKKKRRKSMKPSPEDESIPPCRVSFPLTVSLKITTKCVGSVTICFYYLPFFNAVCSSVTSIDLETDHASLKDIFVDKSFLLHNLFEGDSGKFSPNSAVSVQIRKYGGTNFSAAVRQYGFPFKVTAMIGWFLMPETSKSSTEHKFIRISIKLRIFYNHFLGKIRLVFVQILTF
ncbi:PREDICTED: THO complex subunit 5 homolog A-like [Amphimedon queenslandica]|uniref:Uncharacterized protein n=1 Tax=Amphimedon queenslandica TaxID=400682 RepID=A0AAN0JYH7_AMPQE|nr:PREDICTED: THO complex subunit 5 homolog A-like [Amphimedon queenslandica]|eukprot:XP_019861964.1 PREDICTED: THO complex subunit 5 homolog A-like [Amphimedon queenslandica]